MIWLLVVVAVLVVACTAALATAVGAGSDKGGDRGAFGAMTSSSAHLPLDPDGFQVGDIDALIFDRALRGYRMDEVDGVLTVLRDQLAARDATIARLRGEVAEPGPVATPPGE